jgi:NitT/TauT family transport system substrate-binding protein
METLPRCNILALCLAFAFALAGASGAPGSAKNRIHLAVGSKPGNIVYLQVDLARALGYFAEKGLDFDFEYFDGGTGAAAALASGHVEFSGNSIDHAMKLRAEGKDLKMVASFTSLPTVTLVVRRDLRPEIRSIKDLKGRRIGVTAIGAGTHVLAASIFKKAGYSLADVTILPVGSGKSLIAAMDNREIDAAMATDPTTTVLLMAGRGSLLLDMVTFEETQRIFTGEYQFTGLMTRADVIAARPELVQSVVDVFVKTNQFIATHSAADISARLPANIVQDRFVYVKSLEHSRPSFSADGMVTKTGVANNLQSQITFASIHSTAGLDPTSFFDMRFVLKALGR